MNETPASLRDDVAPDIATASDDYAARFAGATGAWFLDVQARAVMRFLPPDRTTRILDVGGGHNQLAEPLCRAGYAVTVHGSAATCRQRVEANPVTRACAFVVSPATALPFHDRAFDTVLSVRMLAHVADWPALIAEMCRVAGTSVIAEFPDSGGLNRVAPMLFDAKQQIEKNTRHWQAFRVAQIRDAFARHGFRAAGVRRQFFLPMVLYRALRCRPLAVGLEGGCRILGLTRAWGSPVVMKFVREDK